LNNGVPFSSIDQFLADKKVAPYALCDTSFLVAMSDEDGKRTIKNAFILS